MRTDFRRRISASQIFTYRDCPYKLKLNKVDRLEPIHFNPEIFDVGSAVHDTIEEFYKHYYTFNMSHNDILYYTYEEIFKPIWSEHNYKDPQEMKDDLAKCYTCLNNFATFESNRRDPTQPSVEIEVPTDKLYGFIDFYNPITHRAYDWKTSKNPRLSKTHYIQSIIYKHLIKAKYDINLDKFYFLFLYPNVTQKVTFDKPKVIKIEKQTFDTVDEILNAYETNDFEKKPRTPRMCKWCQFKYYCKTLKL